MNSLHVKTVAVIGAGTIGASWAAYFLSRGLAVRAWDPAPEAARFLDRFIARAWPVLQQLGATQAEPAGLSVHASPEEAVEGAQFVQESAPEQLDTKQSLYAQFAPALAPEALVASSSSGLMMSDIARGLACAPRCAIGHPFNPPHLIPLVEVVGGERTAPETVAACVGFYRAIGKHPVKLNREAPGHLANRLQAALWREAVHAVASGIASVADVDAAIAYGPGLRWALMGPHLTYHLAGGEGGMSNFMRYLGPANEAWWRDLGNPQLTPEVQRAIIEGVAAEAAGQDVPALAAKRDALLLELLQLVSGRRPAEAG